MRAFLLGFLLASCGALGAPVYEYPTPTAAEPEPTPTPVVQPDGTTYTQGEKLADDLEGQSGTAAAAGSALGPGGSVAAVGVLAAVAAYLRSRYRG